MTDNIAGKVVVVTRASSGLGEATARHLAGLDAKVVLGARRLERLQALAAELELPNEAAVRTDVTDPDQVKALVDGAVALQGRIADFYEQHAIPADSFARMVAFAIGQPDEVDVSEILFRPTAQDL